MTDDITTEPTVEGDATEEWSPATDPDGYTLDDVAAKDWYLDTLINFMLGRDDQEPGELGLTVQSNGVLVSGMVISRPVWIEGNLKKLIDGTKGEPVSGSLGELFNETNDWLASEVNRRLEADLPYRVRKFLHMRDVRILYGNTHVQVPFWRGSVADITGWSLGSWNPPG
jgi:hypothetical protein